MSEASGFWVGPPEAPDSYQLVALLGAGGEGEVWRANAPDGTSVALKVLPASIDIPQDVLDGVMSIRHPGLARIAGSFVGSPRHLQRQARQYDVQHRYVVMEFVDGVPLDQWIADNPDASPGLVRKILRPVAGALDALHAGTASTGAIVHGDVKPSNIIVTKSGNGVLVDVGLANVGGVAATTGHTPAYAAPELREPGVPGSIQTDSYAFVTALAASMVGRRPPVDSAGFVEPRLLGTWLATSSRLRLRPLWRRRIQRVLTARSGRRPTRLQRWLDAPTRGAIAAAVLAVAVVAVATTASAIGGGGHTKHEASVPTAPLASAPTSTSSAASFGVDAESSVNSPTKHPKSSASASPASFVVNYTVWPATSGCTSDSPIASGPGRVDATGKQYEGFAYSLLNQPDGGPWLGGMLTTSYTSSVKIHIQDVRIAIDGDPGPPGFIYKAGGPLPGVPLGDVCPTSAVNSVPPLILNETIDLDASRSARVGQDLAAGQPLDLFAQVSSCTLNARFHVAIDYTLPGSNSVKTWTDNDHTFVIYATASGTEYDIGYETVAGTIVMTRKTVSGHDPSCGSPKFAAPKVDPAGAASLTASPKPSSSHTTKPPSTPPTTTTPPPPTDTSPSTPATS